MSGDFWGRFQQLKENLNVQSLEPGTLDQMQRELDPLVGYLPKRDQERYKREIEELSKKSRFNFEVDSTLLSIGKHSIKDVGIKVQLCIQSSCSSLAFEEGKEFCLGKVEGAFRIEGCKDCKISRLHCHQLRMHGCSKVELHDCSFESEGIIEGCREIVFVNCKNAKKIRDFDNPFDEVSPNIEIRE